MADSTPNIMPLVVLAVAEKGSAVKEVMMTDELVEEILNHLPTEDIKSCLRVNRLWAKEAMKHVLKWSCVEFLGDDLTTDIGKYMEEMKDNCHGCVSFRKFDREDDITAVIALGEKYTNKIEQVTFTLWWKTKQVLPAFHCVTSLTLRLRTKDIMDSDSFGIRYYFAEHDRIIPWPMFLPPRDLIMPNLKTLTLEEVTPKRCVGYPSVAAFLIGRMLPMCPILERLNLHSHNQMPALIQLMETLKTTPRSTIHKLSFIGIDDNRHNCKPNPPSTCFCAKHIPKTPRILRLLPLVLTVLEMDLSKAYWSTSTAYATTVEQLLTNHGPTLKKLVLRHTKCDYNDLKVALHIPIMPNLEEFKVSYNRVMFPNNAATKTEGSTTVWGRRHCKFPKLNKIWIGRQENVTKLILGAHIALLDTFFNPKEQSYPSVKTAWVDERAWTLSPKIRMKMGQLFPNAEIAKITAELM